MVTSIRKYLDLLYFEMYKGTEFYHKSEFYNSNIFATFDISNLRLFDLIFSFKYPRSTTLSCKEKGIRNLKFVERTQFFLRKKMWYYIEF